MTIYLVILIMIIYIGGAMEMNYLLYYKIKCDQDYVGEFESRMIIISAIFWPITFITVFLDIIFYGLIYIIVKHILKGVENGRQNS